MEKGRFITGAKYIIRISVFGDDEHEKKYLYVTDYFNNGSVVKIRLGDKQDDAREFSAFSVNMDYNYMTDNGGEFVTPLLNIYDILSCGEVGNAFGKICKVIPIVNIYDGGKIKIADIENGYDCMDMFDTYLYSLLRNQIDGYEHGSGVAGKRIMIYDGSGSAVKDFVFEKDMAETRETVGFFCGSNIAMDGVVYMYNRMPLTFRQCMSDRSRAVYLMSNKYRRTMMISERDFDYMLNSVYARHYSDRFDWDIRGMIESGKIVVVHSYDRMCECVTCEKDVLEEKIAEAEMKKAENYIKYISKQKNDIQPSHRN